MGKTPNPKLQAPEKHQAPSTREISKHQASSFRETPSRENSKSQAPKKLRRPRLLYEVFAELRKELLFSSEPEDQEKGDDDEEYFPEERLARTP